MSRGNGNARRTKEAVEALGFMKDDELSTPGRDVYRHPNDPDRLVKVWAGMSEVAARKVRILADDIAGLSSHGESIPRTVGETARIKREERKRKEAAEREQGSRQRAVDEQAARLKEQRIEAAQRLRARESELRDIRGLMRPGRGWA